MAVSITLRTQKKEGNTKNYIKADNIDVADKITDKYSYFD